MEDKKTKIIVIGDPGIGLAHSVVGKLQDVCDVEVVESNPFQEKMHFPIRAQVLDEMPMPILKNGMMEEMSPRDYGMNKKRNYKTKLRR